MSPDLMAPLIIAVAAAAVLGAAAYYIARWLKGSIKLSLPATAFNHGDTVSGAFVLTARKEIAGNRLFAAAIAAETIRERDHRGKSHTHTREVWRGETEVEGARAYPAGYTGTYSFKVQLPAESAAATPDSLLGQAAQLLLSPRRRINWRVEVRLDAEGVDLAASRQISVGSASGFF